MIVVYIIPACMLVLAGPPIIKWHEGYQEWSSIMGMPAIGWAIIFGTANTLCGLSICRMKGWLILMLIGFPFGALLPFAFDLWVAWRPVMFVFEPLVMVAICMGVPPLACVCYLDRKSTKAAWVEKGGDAARGARIE